MIKGDARRFLPFRVVGLIAVLGSMFFLLPAAAETPDIVGSYQLLSCKMSDGTVLQPPMVMGIMTYTSTHRNSNILVQAGNGRYRSFSTASTYKLTPTEYSETLLFNITNDQVDGKGVVYDLSATSRTVPVRFADGRVEFTPPFDPPAYVFEGNKFTATWSDGRVDTWEKLP